MQRAPDTNEFIHIKDLVKQPVLFNTKQEKEQSTISRRSFYNYLGRLAPASVNALGVGGMLSQTEIQSQIVKERSTLFTQMTGQKHTEVGNYKFKRSQDWVGTFLCGKPIKKVIEYEQTESALETNETKSNKNSKSGGKNLKSVKIKEGSAKSRDSTPSKINLSTSRSKNSAKTSKSKVSDTKSANKAKNTTRSVSDSKSTKKTPGMPRRRLKSKTSGKKDRSESLTSKKSTSLSASKRKPQTSAGCLTKRPQTPKSRKSSSPKNARVQTTPRMPKTPKTTTKTIKDDKRQKSTKTHKEAENNEDKTRPVTPVKGAKVLGKQGVNRLETADRRGDGGIGPTQRSVGKVKGGGRVGAGGEKRKGGGSGERRDGKTERGVSALGGKGTGRGKENEAAGARASRVVGKSAVPVKKRSPAPVVGRGLLFLERNPDKTESRKKPGYIKTPVKNPAADEKMLKAAAKLC